MTEEQILQVVDHYDAILYPMAAAISEQESGNRLQHTRWMCKQIPIFIKENKIEKAHRWLGFIQGVLWSEGLYTIRQMCEHNR